MTNNINFYAKIAGIDPHLLVNEPPLSKQKISILAKTMLIPVVIWAFSMFNMAYNMFNIGLLGSVTCGIICAALIFVIDQSIILAGRSWKIALLRIILAFLVSVIGSYFVDEIIFYKDIQSKLMEEKNDTLNHRIDRLHAKYGAAMVQAELNQKSKYDDWIKLSSEAAKEADGSGGSRVAKVGRITELKVSIANSVKEKYDQSMVDLNRQRVELMNEKDSIILATAEEFDNPGLFKKARIVFELATQDTVTRIFFAILTLLLLILEILPVMLKYLMPKTSFEKKLEMIELIAEKRNMLYNVNPNAPNRPERLV